MPRKPKSAPVIARKPGKPPYVPTREDRRLVEAYVGVGMTQDEICGALSRPVDHERGPLKMSVPTLHKHFRRELDTAQAKTVARMRIKLIAKADAGDVQALLHVNRVFGWNEKLIVELNNVTDPKTLTEAELDAEIARLTKRPAVVRAMKTVH